MAIDLRNGGLSVNGVTEGAVSSDGLQILVTDGVDPITPDDVIVSGSSVEIQVPAGTSRTTATLLKTGQTTSYRTGDDGDIEAGRAASFTTLAENNPFGNTNRFTDELGGTTYTNNIVIDWSTYDGSTVLGYRRTSSGSAVSWNNAIDGALAVSIGSFTTGWRLANVNEMQNIMNFSISFTSGAFSYEPFNNTDTALWTSNTLQGSSSNKFYVFNFGFGINFQDQANTLKYIPVRTFTVTGTTLS
jgi:hypothetical protein